MVDPGPPPPIARLQPEMEVSNGNRKLGTCCRRGCSIGRVNFAGEEIRLIRSSSQCEKDYAAPLCLIQVEFGPAFHHLQHEQGGKAAI
jgi:hypothetical protein